jgi:hypothetical protein
MGNPPNWFSKYALRGTILLSTYLGLFWTVGLIADVCFAYDRPAVLGAVLLAFTGSLAWIIAFICPNFLNRIDNVSNTRLTVMLLTFGVLSYLALIPICALGGYFLVSHGPDPKASDGSIAIALLALWLPLWWAPAFGAVWTWVKGNKHK